jgi:hypothetical protein
MAKLTAWLVTLVEVLLVLAQANLLPALTVYHGWIIALAVLAVGIGKLLRNYKIIKYKK